MTDLRFIHRSHHWSRCTTLGKFFAMEKLEDKPEIKRGLPLSRMWWKNRRLDQTDQRLRKCRLTKWSRALDRPTRWANDQKHVVSTEKPRKVKKQPRNVSWLNLTTHWGKFFKSGFEKFWREKRLNTWPAVSIQGERDRSGNLDSTSTRVIPHWGKFFSKLKNCEEELVRDSGS